MKISKRRVLLVILALLCHGIASPLSKAPAATIRVRRLDGSGLKAHCPRPLLECVFGFDIDGLDPKVLPPRRPGQPNRLLLGLYVQQVTITDAVCDCQILTLPGGDLSYQLVNCAGHSHSHYEYRAFYANALDSRKDKFAYHASTDEGEAEVRGEGYFIPWNSPHYAAVSKWVVETLPDGTPAHLTNFAGTTPVFGSLAGGVTSVETGDTATTHFPPPGFDTGFGGDGIGTDGSDLHKLELAWTCYSPVIECVIPKCTP